jgi:membrane fusion protein (multidrug efflux system)
MKYLIAIFAAFFSTSCGQHEEAFKAESLPAVSVETAVVKSKQVPVFADVVGTVVPRLQAQVTAKVTGRVLEMKAVPGMRVKAGEVLATLAVAELDASLSRAEAALIQANRDFDRYKSLLAGNAATRAEFEQAESQQRMAVATVEEIRAMVSNATVTAPFDGTVTQKFQQPGDLASPARPLFAMEDASLLRLKIDVAESLAGQLKIDDAFRVRIEGAGVDLKGKVTEIAPSADVGSRTFSVKIDLPENEALRAGQFGRAFLPRGDRAALRVPDSAVISRGQMDYLFIAADGKAQLRIVRIGGTSDSETEILAGLDDGETIVLTPPAELRDGQALNTR